MGMGLDILMSFAIKDLDICTLQQTAGKIVLSVHQAIFQCSKAYQLSPSLLPGWFLVSYEPGKNYKARWVSCFSCFFEKAFPHNHASACERNPRIAPRLSYSNLYSLTDQTTSASCAALPPAPHARWPSSRESPWGTPSRSSGRCRRFESRPRPPGPPTARTNSSPQWDCC